MNLLLAQSGGPTAVLNQSLVGALEAARRSRKFGKILGSRNGLLGILQGKLENLGLLSKDEKNRIRRLPGAYLGSHRLPLSAVDFTRILGRIEGAGIGAFAYIGGNGSMQTARRLLEEAEARGQVLAGAGVPKTVDNDLPETDHCPGYGSVLRHNALAVHYAGLDSQAVGLVDRVKIIEVMGRDTGWIAAGSALARDLGGPGLAPHLILMPERKLETHKFLQGVVHSLKKRGHCVVVTSEGAKDERNRPLSASRHRLDLDGAGQAQYGGAAQALARLVRDRLKVKAREEKYGTSQRVAGDRVSPTDAREAYGVGAEAVRLLLGGESGFMVTLLRKPGRAYVCSFGTVPLVQVGRFTRVLPISFITASGMDVNRSFYEYARPLAALERP